MIEVYQGELEVVTTLPSTYTVTDVTIFQYMYDSVTGEKTEVEVVTSHTASVVGSNVVVTTDVSGASAWPSPFYIKIDVIVNGDPHFVKVDCDVVTPYVSIEEIMEAGGISSDQNSPSYKPYSSIRDAESLARHVIESYTGRFFGRQYSKWDLQGTDSTVLFSDEHVTWAGAIFHDDEAIYSATTGSYTTSDSGHCLTVKDDSGEKYGFPEGYSYSVIGIFGEHYVPQDVRLAAKMLAVHYLCSDAAIQNNYIDQTKFGESANRYNRLAFVGTGLHAVDLLLDHYRFHNYKVI